MKPLIFSPAFYWMESWMDGVLIWLMVFFFVIIAKIIVVKRKGIRKSGDSMFFTEAIGLPITMGQSIVFARAVWLGDWVGMLITLFWGPGFLLVAGLVLRSKFKQRAIDWSKSRRFISWMCKLTYLLYIGLAVWWDMPKLAFALSAWIASDQIEKNFASLDADRARRSFHDIWLLRLLYPALLLSPLWQGLGPVYGAYGVLLLAVWASGLLYVWRQREFMNLPDDPTLLRNMMYFRRPSSEAPAVKEPL
jgi:hypothetical protein